MADVTSSDLSELARWAGPGSAPGLPAARPMGVLLFPGDRPAAGGGGGAAAGLVRLFGGMGRVFADGLLLGVVWGDNRAVCGMYRVAQVGRPANLTRRSNINTGQK